MDQIRVNEVRGSFTRIYFKCYFVEQSVSSFCVAVGDLRGHAEHSVMFVCDKMYCIKIDK